MIEKKVKNFFLTEGISEILWKLFYTAMTEDIER
jgi:hypothetical protein